VGPVLAGGGPGVTIAQQLLAQPGLQQWCGGCAPIEEPPVLAKGGQVLGAAGVWVALESYGCSGAWVAKHSTQQMCGVMRSGGGCRCGV